MTKIGLQLFAIIGFIGISILYSLCYVVTVNEFHSSGNDLTFDIDGCPSIPKKYKNFENMPLIIDHQRKMHIYLLLGIFNQFCIEYGIDYILSDDDNGLGSIRFHTLIPWNHNISLNIAHESINLFKEYLSSSNNVKYNEYNAYNINILPTNHSNVSLNKYRTIFWYHSNITLANKLIFKISHELHKIDTKLIFDPIDSHRSYSIDALNPYFNIVEHRLIDQNNEVELLKKCNENDNILQKIHYKRIYFANDTNKYCQEIATRVRPDSNTNMSVHYSFTVNSSDECLFDMKKETVYLITHSELQNRGSFHKYSLNLDLLTRKSNILSSKQLQNISFLVGIGSKKVGSTYFGSHLMPILLDFIKCDYFMYDETEFWRKCLDPLKPTWECSMDSYLKKLTHYDIKALRTALNNGSKVLLFEKTASYVRTFHTSFYLSYFAHAYNTYLYVILRNPVTRLYSQIYHDWTRIKGRWPWAYPTETKVSQYILDAMAEFRNKYTYLNAIMNELKITKDCKNNNDLNVSKILQLYENGFYKMWTHSNVYLPEIFISVYLPQILVWINAFYGIPKQFKQFRARKLHFKDRFRVILSEELWGNPVDQAIKLVSWVTHTNEKSVIYEQFKYNFKNLEKTFDLKKHRNIFGEHKGEQRSWTPKGSDPFKLNFIAKLNSFYADSQQRLFWFLRDNPDLKL